MNNPKVSIIVPIYNVEKYLAKCLDSILNQTYDNLEIILIDDGSTDGSSDIAENYTLKDPRITVIHQRNRGQSSARNLGLKFATGNFISFIDADDEIKPTFISELLHPLVSDEAATLSICGFHYKRLTTSSAADVFTTPLRAKKPHETFKAYILQLLAIDGRLYSSVNKLYRANVAKKLHFDESINFAEDTKFVLDYLKKSPGKLTFVLKPLYIYNSGTEGSTMKSVALDWHNWQNSYRNLKDWLGPHPTIREKFYLRLVHLRWRISHRKQISRAKKSKS
ncbi:glycosyltransferase family 2 protein [Candidatus Saccharibacteria bacterium]|nr:glycosyltransferase family 2 protein [Candidatus Saccharibacteria bacterium]MBQ6375618.1 glycosyltransferase family 2 protein [Candidatus Saccharibacteria bacterium]